MLLVDIFLPMDVDEEKSCDVSRDIPITEIVDFDPTINVVWKDIDGTNYGFFTINGKEYRAFIQTSTFPNPIIPNVEYVNVGFQRKDQDEHWVLTSNDDYNIDKYPTKVLGVVAYNISLKLKEQYSHINIIIFGMTTQVSKRGRIYAYVANKILHDWPGTRIVNGIRALHGIVSIIFMPHISKQDQERFIDYVNNLSLNKPTQTE